MNKLFSKTSKNNDIYILEASSTMFTILYCVVINIKLNNKRISILTRTFNPTRTTA